MSGIITSFFAALGHMDAARQLVDAEARFIAVREKHDSVMPLYGTFIGHDGLSTFIDGLRAAFDTQLFAIDGVLENETQGYAHGRFIHRIIKNGALFQSHWALHCQFRNGKISLYRFYEDTAALEQAFGIATICREEPFGPKS